ncbi:MAG: hypothetical protein SVR08_15675, partial [Spirochaetota bacterium]|nr:hypothetical protein [Spirochaetota bacterium]
KIDEFKPRSFMMKKIGKHGGNVLNKVFKGKGEKLFKKIFGEKGLERAKKLGNKIKKGYDKFKKFNDKIEEKMKNKKSLTPKEKLFDITKGAIEDAVEDKLTQPEEEIESKYGPNPGMAY